MGIIQQTLKHSVWNARIMLYGYQNTERKPYMVN